MTDGLAEGPWTVNGSDETDAVDVARWVEVAESTLRGERAPAGNLDLIFVDEATMAELNREHMGGDGPTDVLSFPLDAELDDLEFDLDAGPPVHLGDVVVCEPIAERQAPDHAGTVEAELTLLVVHGVLHVLGHDHAEPEETVVMQARERLHLDRYGYPHPSS